MKNVLGPPVEGDDFFGREKELAYAWKIIEDGNNLILPSPRRVGKTSFALKLLAIAKSKGWDIMSINLEKIPTEQEFVALFIEKLKDQSWWERVKEKGASLAKFITQLRPKVKYGEMEMEFTWESNKEDIYKQLSQLLPHKEKTLIFADELTVLLTNIIAANDTGKKDVSQFLHWLREIRITAGSQIRWIYCSSVGIENFTHTHGLSDTINDVPKLKLKSYTLSESIEMLKLLSASCGVQLTEEIYERIVTKLDYIIPFFLQIIFNKIHYCIVVENIAINEDIVDLAYNQLVEENHFNTWIERIEKQYGNYNNAAFLLLKHACQERSGTVREQFINILAGAGMDEPEEKVMRCLYMLQNDGYLIEESKSYRFRSPLLRDFWFNRFVK
jgi:hypothetical protein